MQCLARDPRQAPERFLAPISSICTTAGQTIMVDELTVERDVPKDYRSTMSR